MNYKIPDSFIIGYRKKDRVHRKNDRVHRKNDRVHREKMIGYTEKKDRVQVTQKN